MIRATWKGQLLAESDNTVLVEGNHYFPPDSVKRDLLQPAGHRTTCPWKGEAHYFNVVVDGESNENAAWTYPQPKEKAQHIKDHVAFWRGVAVEEG